MSMRASGMMLMALLCGAMLSGCSGCDNDGGGNLDTLVAGDLLVSPTAVSFPQVTIGQDSVQTLSLRNVASDRLTIFALNLQPVQGSSIEDLTIEGAPSTPFVIEGNGRLELTVRYTPSSTRGARAQISIASSDPDYTRDSPLLVPVNTLDSLPFLDVQPSTVRFPRLPTGQQRTQEITLTNLGSAPLVLFEEPTYSGGQDMRVTWEPRSYPVTLEVYDGEKLEDLPQNYVLRGEIEYRPLGEGADTGQIRIVSNDNSSPDPADMTRGVRLVEVGANSSSACIFVDRIVRNFGQVPVGRAAPQLVRVQNCGTEDLQISDVRITQNSADNEFELDLGEWDINGTGAVTNPVVLAPEAEGEFFINYIPLAEGTDQGRVTIYSNDPVQPELELSLAGRGSIGVCPIADARATIRGVTTVPMQRLAVTPLQYVVLDGSGSMSGEGDTSPIVEYRWRIVSKPSNDPTRTEPLPPASEDPNDMNPMRREVRVLLAGTYQFGLTVVNAAGFESCEESIVEVISTPSEKILIELTWYNPSDPDESDNQGADVDLHFMKMGPGRWFESPYDIYYRNPNQGTGNNNYWNPESPSLDIDVTSGAGPENVNMDDPAACEWYAVGVHYFNPGRFGTAYATIRIYIDDVVAFESTRPLTARGQFWDVVRIHWDGTTATPVEVQGNALPAPPSGQPGRVTDDMRTSGLCTQQNLY